MSLICSFSRGPNVFSGCTHVLFLITHLISSVHFFSLHCMLMVGFVFPFWGLSLMSAEISIKRERERDKDGDRESLAGLFVCPCSSQAWCLQPLLIHSTALHRWAIWDSLALIAFIHFCAPLTGDSWGGWLIEIQQGSNAEKLDPVEWRI